MHSVAERFNEWLTFVSNRQCYSIARRWATLALNKNCQMIIAEVLYQTDDIFFGIVGIQVFI